MEFNPVQTNEMPIREKLANILWGMINSTVFRITPPQTKLFKRFRVALLKLFNAKVAWNCFVHPSAKIEYPWRLTMGNFSSLGERCWVYALDRIIIGEKSTIGKEVNIITGSHDISSPMFHLVTKPVIIGNGVWITTRATILPGVSLGDFAVIANNSVVTKDVESWTVVGGNPAKVIKKRIIKDE